MFIGHFIRLAVHNLQLGFLLVNLRHQCWGTRVSFQPCDQFRQLRPLWGKRKRRKQLPCGRVGAHGIDALGDLRKIRFHASHHHGCFNVIGHRQPLWNFLAQRIQFPMQLDMRDHGLNLLCRGGLFPFHTHGSKEFLTVFEQCWSEYAEFHLSVRVGFQRSFFIEVIAQALGVRQVLFHVSRVVAHADFLYCPYGEKQPLYGLNASRQLANTRPPGLQFGGVIGFHKVSNPRAPRSVDSLKLLVQFHGLLAGSNPRFLCGSLQSCPLFRSQSGSMRLQLRIQARQRLHHVFAFVGLRQGIEIHPPRHLDLFLIRVTISDELLAIAVNIFQGQRELLHPASAPGHDHFNGVIPNPAVACGILLDLGCQ